MKGLEVLESTPREARDEGWVQVVNDAIAEAWSREAMINFLQWEDPNGCYRDPECPSGTGCDTEGCELSHGEHDPLTFDEALALVVSVVREVCETPDEIRRYSRRR